jgi:thiol-disulfide isomerase/thioredoxin
MKCSTIIAGAAVAVAAAVGVAAVALSGGRETAIVNPEFDNTGHDYFSIHKIELSDTTTAVYADVYHLPNYWIHISSEIKLRDSKGKTYKLLGCNGFELDKEVFMPASGSMSFILSFEPVDRREKVVDIIDLDENRATITGVTLYSAKHSEPVRCLLKGEVLNRPQSSRIALLKDGEDFRTAKVTYIPIRDGKFEHMLYANVEEAYQLIFYDEIMRGAWRPVSFIAETGTCHFSLNSEEEWASNSVRGGKYAETYSFTLDSLQKMMNLRYDTLNAKREKLHEAKKLYTPEANKLWEQIDKLPNDDPKRRALLDQFYALRDKGQDKTQEAKDVDDEAAQLYKTIYVAGLMAYAKEHQDVTGYTFLVQLIRSAVEQNFYQLDVAPMFAMFHDVYEEKYPAHPYTAAVRSYLQAAAIVAGNPCPGVVAEDSEGREVRLPELVRGKVALVHLWASWCGPCRRHGKEMIPIYEAYKDKGFTVVGIAREQRRELMLAAADKDKYPWENYLELNDKHAIWTKFGIGNAGGGDFLVDAQGNFLAVKTSPEEVKGILHQLFD